MKVLVCNQDRFYWFMVVFLVIELFALKTFSFQGKQKRTWKSSGMKRNAGVVKLCENTKLKAVIFFLPHDYVIGRLEPAICGEYSYTIALLFRQRWRAFNLIVDQFEMTMIDLKNGTTNSTDKHVRKCNRMGDNLRKSFQSENQKYFILITWLKRHKNQELWQYVTC